MDRVELSPYALVAEDKARAFVHRDQAGERGLEDWIPSCINAATAKLEAHCGRHLAARVWRNPVTLSCTTTADSETVTGASVGAQVKVLDDVSGVGIRQGTRVASITNPTTLVLTKKATAPGTVDLTFGSRVIKERGDGDPVLHIHEAPIETLADIYSIKRRGLSGVLETIDLADADLRSEAGPGIARLELASGVWGKDSRYEIECRAGYPAAGSGAGLQWESAQLEWAALRMVQVMWQDFATAAGRTGSLDLMQAVQRFESFRLPDDIRADLAPYRRIG